MAVNIISFIYILHLSVIFCLSCSLLLFDCIDKQYLWNIYQHSVVVVPELDKINAL